MVTPTNQTILSGLQPSGALHIGNYLGAIKQWITLQEENEAYFCIVDLHAITVSYDPAELSKVVLDTAAMYLAAGLDPKKSTIFVQSHVPAHTELAWLLATQTPLGELNRMTQFKDKAAKQPGQESLSLYAYPVLMAADILLYQADIVPVGDDQVQHIELTRDIAKRFNNKFGDTFTLPKPFMNTNTARIMSLTDPTKKMSKSDGEKTYIALTDNEATSAKKIASAVTDTEPVFSFAESGPAVKNLLKIYQALSEQTNKEIETAFNHSNYQEFKQSLAKLINDHLAPIRERYQEIRPDEKILTNILEQGATKVQEKADYTLRDVKQKMGLL